MEMKKGEFILTKLKQLPTGGFHVKWKKVWMSEEEKMASEEYSIKRNFYPRPKLLSLIDGLKAMLCTVYGYDKLEPDEFNALSTMILINSITITGSDELTSVIITGQKPSGLYVINLVSHPISLQGSLYGFENDLKELIKLLNEEVYNYVYKNKQAQTSMDLKVA